MSCVKLFLSSAAFTLCAACGTSDLPTSPSATAPGNTAGVANQRPGLTTQAPGGSGFAAIRQATAAFHDVGKAVAAGYLAPDAHACVAGPEGGMGIHSVNPALAGDQVIDPLRPEVLLYAPTGGGAVRLAGVEYFQAVLLRHKTTGAVSPWFAPTPWPAADYDVVTERPQLAGQPFDGPMPGHEPGMPWHYDLHVWTWMPNPSGDFAPFNPRLSCGGTAEEHTH